jgi:MFS family permease
VVRLLQMPVCAACRVTCECPCARSCNCSVLRCVYVSLADGVGRSGWIMLAVCRVMAGVGVGGSIPSVFTLYTEYLPVQRRGMLLSIVAAFWTVGTVFTAGAWLCDSGNATGSWHSWVFVQGCAA